jgi:RNA polymerase sigma-70 factor (ECF subfamily)
VIVHNVFGSFFLLCRVASKSAHTIFENFFNSYQKQAEKSFSLFDDALPYLRMPEVFELIAAYRKSRDPKLLNEVLSLLASPISLFLVAKIPAQDVSDVRQDVLLSIFKGIRAFKGESREQFFSWCYIIARAAIATYYRKREKLGEPPPDYETMLKMLEKNAERAHRKEEELRDAREALAFLQRADSDCFDLLYKRHVLEFSFDEIGRLFGISANAARMRVERCAKSLAKG